MSLIIDGFLPEFDELRNYADVATFLDVMNPYDGVVYPLICAEIPEHIKSSIFQRLEEFKGAEIQNPTIFMRRSPAGIHCPHAVHSDLSMGAHSLMLYLNRSEHCQGGTSFLSHMETGVSYNPESPELTDIIVRDQNDASAWHVVEMIEMRPNRALIFDAGRLHRAEPNGGFGTTAQDIRVVLTCFFS